MANILVSQMVLFECLAECCIGTKTCTCVNKHMIKSAAFMSFCFRSVLPTDCSVQKYKIQLIISVLEIEIIVNETIQFKVNFSSMYATRAS